MLALAAKEAFTDKDWIFEIKWDGFRAIAYVEEPFSLRSRNGKELKQNFPELQQITSLAKDIVVDGEIVVMSEGTPNFQALLKRGQAVSVGEIKRQSQRAPAVYIVFDIIEKAGKALVDVPLMERKAILKDSLKEGANVLLCDYIDEKGEAYFKLILEKGLEGVVAKERIVATRKAGGLGAGLRLRS
jgi:ATP-dependent DNA ligase